MSISRVIASALLVVTMSFPWSGSASLDAASAAGSLGAFTGFVVDDSGAKLRGMTVTVTGTSSPDDVLTSAITDGDGYFVVGDIPPGEVLIRIEGDGQHLGEWWNDAYRLEDATPATARAGSFDHLGEIQLISGGVVLGRVTSATGAGIAGVWAWARDIASSPTRPVGVGISDVEGRFEIADLPPGEYDIHFEAVSTTSPTPYVSEWFDGALWRMHADTVSVSAASLISGIDAQLAPVGAAATERLEGADRYATAAAIAARFPPGVPVTYVATGRAFPDALSAASAAARHGGPLLLVEPDAIPEPIARELRRLAPERIVVVGGTGAVSAAVEVSLASFAGPGGVRRDAGTDRYSTSRIVAERAFAGLEPGTVYMTSGTDFPDALSASAAAAARGAPVLLVKGAEHGIDTPTRQVLYALGVSGAHIVGGAGVVDIGIESGLRAFFGEHHVTRIAGPDRYATSAAVSGSTFTPTAINSVFLATGVGFADALAGAALAGAAPAPLLLARRDCVPPTVVDEVRRLSPSLIVPLGGSGVLTSDVLALKPC